MKQQKTRLRPDVAVLRAHIAHSTVALRRNNMAHYATSYPAWRVWYRTHPHWLTVRWAPYWVVR